MKTVSNVLNTNGDNLHAFFRVLWCFSFFGSLFAEIGLLEVSFYLKHLSLIYAINLSSYFIGFMLPIYKATKHKVKMSIPLLIYSFFIIQLTYALVRYLYLLPSYATTELDIDLYIVNFFMVSAIVIGWFVHSHNNLNSERKQHTVNILNSSRMSSVYQEHLRLATDKYNDPYKHVTEADVKLYTEWRKGSITIDFSSEEAKVKKDINTIRAIQSVMYLLNYYEFVAAGVFSGDLDEEYLYATIAGISTNLVNYSKPLIDKYQANDKLTWQYIVKLSNNWSDLLDRERKENGN